MLGPRLGAAAACAVAATCASTAGASPQDLFGFGVRSGGMGMAGPASAEDYEGVFGSPALLAETRSQSLTLGASAARHSLSVDVSGRGRLSGDRFVPASEMRMIHIGAALPLPFGGALRDRITFGVGFLEPAKFLVAAKILYPERYQYPIVGPRVQSLAVILGLGVRVTDWLYVGVGYEALSAVIGQILISVDSTGRVGSRTDDQDIAAYAPIASVAADVTERIRVGATFRGELVGRFVINIRAQDLGLSLPDFNVAGLAQYDPYQLHLEARYSTFGNKKPASPAIPGTIAVVGVIGRAWSRYPGPTEPTVLANTEWGTGSPPLGARDTLSPRVGVEHTLRLTPRAGLRLRGGYAYEPTPLPLQTLKENLLDNDRHVLTAGVGVQLDKSLPLRLDFCAQLHLLAPRTHEKTAETHFETGTRLVRTGGTIWMWGMTAGVQF